MSTSVDTDPVQEAVFEQAAAWYVRHRTGDLTQAEKEAFLDWLSTSKLNVQEYLRMVQLRQHLTGTFTSLSLERTELMQRAREELAGNITPLAADVSSVERLPKRRSAWRSLPAVLAAGLVCAAGVAWMANVLSSTHTIRVARGEQRTVQLADGSTMHVNALSEARVRFSKEERLIELVQGQALFEVARDPRRPFRVRAGTTDVVAVGTQFDIYRRAARDITVTVIQGKVDVVSTQPGEPMSESREPARVRVAAGEQVEIKSAGAAPAAHDTDVRVATAWMRREAIFRGEPLAQVVDELNRYIAVPIRIEDANLRSMRVRAVFNAYDSESFIAFLRQYDVEVEYGGEVVRVRSRSATPAVSARH